MGVGFYSKKVDIPVYSFATHSRQKETLPLYSPHVLIVEGILAFHDPRVAAMMDVKVGVRIQKRSKSRVLKVTSAGCRSLLKKIWTFVSEEEVSGIWLGLIVLSTVQANTFWTAVLRDIRDRGRTVDGTVKNWFNFVKPSYRRFIEPQRLDADIIVRRGRENTTAIGTSSMKKGANPWI